MDEKDCLISGKEQELQEAQYSLKNLSQQQASLDEVSKQNSHLSEAVDALRTELSTESQRFRENDYVLRKALEEAKKEVLYEVKRSDGFQRAISELSLQIKIKDEKIKGFKCTDGKIKQDHDVMEAETTELRKEAERLKTLLRSQLEQSRDKNDGLEKKQEKAQKEAQKELDRSDRLQARIADIQSSNFIKDNEIEALKGTITTGIDYNDALESEVIDLRSQLKNESKRADALEMENDAIKMARGFLRRNHSDTLLADNVEINRLVTLVREKESHLKGNENELKQVQDSLRTSIEQNSVLLDKVAHFKEEAEHHNHHKLYGEGIDALQEKLMISDQNRKSIGENMEERMKKHINTKKQLESEQKITIVLQNELNAKDKASAQMYMDYNELCESVKSLASARREEVKELQAETTKLHQVIKEKGEEINSLKKSLKGMGNVTETPRSQTDMNLRLYNKKYEERLQRLNETNEDLRSKVKALVNELYQLGEKLNSQEQVNNPSHSTMVLKYKNEALRKQVEKLKRQYDGLERSITRVSL